MVQSARVVGRRHPLWHASRRVGHWMRFLWTLFRSAIIARQFWSRSNLSNQEDSGYATRKRCSFGKDLELTSCLLSRQSYRSSCQFTHVQSVLPWRVHPGARHNGDTWEEVPVRLRQRSKLYESKFDQFRFFRPSRSKLDTPHWPQ